MSAFVARFLLHALPPETDEGTLTRARARIVRRETLADAARGLGLAERLIMGAGEIADNRQAGDSPLADAYEALIGALFLDAGYDAAEAFVNASLSGILAEVAASPAAFAPDPKTALQIRLQAAGRGLPRYEITGETGTGQNIVFTTAVFAGDDEEPLGTGRGANKRAAQTEAARAALDRVAP